MTTKKILFVTGCRSDFATIKGILTLLKDVRSIDSKIFVTGPHTLKIAGLSSKEIKKLGFKIDGIKKILGKSVIEDFVLVEKGIDSYLANNTIDAAVLCGDRSEMLASALALFFRQIPIFHIHGGEITNGGLIDDNIRHAITKFSSIHFVATCLNAEIVRRLGEEEWRIFRTGSPDIDELVKYRGLFEQETLKKLGLKRNNYNILLFHPETLAGKKNYSYTRQIILALNKIEGKTVVISPNNDVYSDFVRRAYVDCKKEKYLFFPSLDRTVYLTLLKNCRFLVGNSSGGIIEAATFKIPVINLGYRQDGRQRNSNVIDVPKINYVSILAAFKKGLSDSFQDYVRKSENIYGLGDSDKKIVKIMVMILRKYSKEKLIHKRFET